MFGTNISIINGKRQRKETDKRDKKKGTFYPLIHVKQKRYPKWKETPRKCTP
jgi:hypothetical protein